MNRRKELEKDLNQQELFEALSALNNSLDSAFHEKYDRSLPFTELMFDRWERAKKLGFGEGSSIYDNSLVFGKVSVGKNCWVGPFTILDGSGGLVIGDFCTISSGTHIYSHDNVKQTLSSGNLPIDREKVIVGKNTYIGPNTIISKGVSIGDYCVVGSQSFLKSDVPDYSIVAGQPAVIIGKVIIDKEQISFNYKK
ncbi:MAG: acyltransferase [Ekhidna sp.]